jgi:hypothetical protein
VAIRTTAAAAVDADVTQLLTDLQTYFALQQSPPDVNVRSLFVRWFHGKLITLDGATAQAARTSNLEDPACWGKSLTQIDPLT